MADIAKYFKDGFEHHAYLMVGEVSGVLAALEGVLEKMLGRVARAHPDFFLVDTVSFAVGDSRLIREKHHLRPIAGDKRFFVIAARTFTDEAQNALLKTMEDPTGHSVFFILTPTDETLLPTLKSRLQIIRVGETVAGADVPGDNMYDKFLSAPDVSDRLLIVGGMLEEWEGDDEKNGREGEQKMIRQNALRFLSGLEEAAAKRFHDNAERAPKWASFLRDVMKVKGYLNHPSPAVRMVMEYVALSCPSC